MCQCGWRHEDPRGGEMRLRNHVRSAEKQEPGTHEMLGWVDVPSGEILATSGLAALKLEDPEAFRDQQTRAAQAKSRHAAERRHGSGPGPKGREETDEPAGQDAPPKGSRGAGVRQARVLTRDLDLSERVELLFGLDVDLWPEQFDPQVNTDPKARAEDLSRWIEDMAVLAHIHVPQLRQAYDEALGRMGYRRGEEAV